MNTRRGHLPDSHPTSTPGILREFDRAARLRVVQLGVLAVVSLVVILVTLSLARSLENARTEHRRNAAIASQLVDEARDAHGIIESYLRHRVQGSPAVLPAGLIGRMFTLGTAVQTLVEQEQRIDPAAPPAVAARLVSHQFAGAMDLMRRSLRNGRAGTDEVVSDVLEGPVTRYFDALDEWTQAARDRATESLDRQDERVRTLVLWLAFLMAALALGGLGMHLWFGRTRDRLMRALADAAAEQAALHRVAAAVAETDDPVAVFQVIADEVADLLHTEGGWVDECDRDRARTVAQHVPDHWQPLAQRSDPRVAIAPASVRGMALRTGRPARIDDYRRVPGAIPQSAIDLGIRTAVAAPVVVDGRAWGVVVAMTEDPDRLPPGREQALVPFARLAAVAVSNARARALLAERASTDPLTLLPNHGAFHRRLAEAVEHARAHDEPLSLVILDIDHFKAINDAYGHPVGDRVLTEVASTMGESVRGGEMLARTGGEEFALLLPGTGRDGARAAAERARRSVRALRGTDVGVVTVSAGVCSLDAAEDAADLVTKADAALLTAKERGRDRTEVHEAGSAPGAARVRRAGFGDARAIEALHALARAVDARHVRTADHCTRVAAGAEAAARALGWPPDRVARLREAALLHDVGMVGVPAAAAGADGADAAALGARMLRDVLTPEQVAWVAMHRAPGPPHEHDAASGAHILAAADAWDTLTHGDAAREPLPPAEAAAALRALPLDGPVVDALLRAVPHPLAPTVEA